MGVFNALVSGSFLPWRRANRETDYETVLSRLEDEITSVQSRLTQIRLRERRASVTLTLQAFFLWAIYTAVCWFFGLLTLRRPHHQVAQDAWGRGKFIGVWLPVVGSPMLIISTRRIVRWWYRRIGAAEDKHLIDLKRQKREKIDEIKRATKYDHLRMLLEKYDEASAKAAIPDAMSTPTKGKSSSKAGTPKNASPASATNTPQQQRHTLSPANNITIPEEVRQRQRAAILRDLESLGPANPSPASFQEQGKERRRDILLRQLETLGSPGSGIGSGVHAAQIRPFAAPVALPKTWMDKLADAILGADPSATGPEQKYALICAKCHAHNGLALREEFNEVQYICPHCGMFNSRRPSSRPVSSPFNAPTSSQNLRSQVTGARSGNNTFGQPNETPSKPSRTEGSRLKLRADESSDDDHGADDEDRPPKATLQEETLMDKKEDAREARFKSLRARKSSSKDTDGMEMDED
ncbi:uncharacterized protein MEPE_04537 [Melanopsichium pennsylvanicum]|uniref:Endoplasmic reticulum junction formation protein lunapark n=2 Tax=Melanopsichium pennsylvanicum TaxID=63383 RepID=A0AAJ5C6S9_9BASI|nr:conserved hypothetical protein [Melanopsichium pennsylvanicum 4]SNX85828.1 uncharacterized protein MEPE_04537 [Melanopsichium pennsylvanicum]